VEAVRLDDLGASRRTRALKQNQNQTKATKTMEQTERETSKEMEGRQGIVPCSSIYSNAMYSNPRGSVLDDKNSP